MRVCDITRAHVWWGTAQDAPGAEKDDQAGGHQRFRWASAGLPNCRLRPWTKSCTGTIHYHEFLQMMLGKATSILRLSVPWLRPLPLCSRLAPCGDRCKFGGLHPRRGSILMYEEKAKEKEKPSGPAPRRSLGGWPEALLLDKVSAVAHNSRFLVQISCLERAPRQLPLPCCCVVVLLPPSVLVLRRGGAA
jgi:hypothetical protein